MSQVKIPVVVRALTRQPWSSTAIVLTLAVGIAATTTVYAVFNHLVFRPTPGVRAPADLVSVAFQPEAGPRTWGTGPPESLALFRSTDTGLQSVALWRGDGPTPIVVRPGEEPRLVRVEFVAPEYLETLGVRARVGRLFMPEETREASHGVAIISEVLWHREFGGRTDVLGRAMAVNGTPFTIVGVVHNYRGWDVTRANTVDVWLPQRSATEPVGLMVGRLKPGVSRTTVESRLREVYEPLRATLDPKRSEMVPWVYTGLRRGLIVPPRLDISFSYVLGIASLLMLLACANAANLLLSRMRRRRQDLALRAALGASRGQLIRSLVVEAFILASIAVGSGLVMTGLTARLLEGVQLFDSVRAVTGISVDWRVVLFAAATGAIAVFAFALAPIVSATRVDLRAVLQQASGSTRRFQRYHRGLVAVQIALSLGLMAGAGVLLQSLWNIRAIDLGMTQTERVFSFTLHPGLINVRGAEATALLTRAVDRLRNTPGIDAVGTANPSAFLQGARNEGRVSLGQGLPQLPVRAERTTVSPDYFKAVGIPLLAGRTFDESETHASADASVHARIINISLARMLFGDQTPVGRHVAVGGRDVIIVGVVGDTKTTFTLREPRPAMVVYEPTGGLFVFSRVYVRATAPLAAAQERVYQVMHEIEPRLPLVDAGTLTDEVERLIPEDRALAQLLAAIAIVSTLLGFGGVYAVTAYSVSERTREFGVRVALGASQLAVIRSAVYGIAPAAVTGAGIGLAGYWMAAQLVTSRLYKVAPLDLRAVGGALILLAVFIAVAAWLPARRAAQVDPVRALRTE